MAALLGLLSHKSRNLFDYALFDYLPRAIMTYLLAEVEKFLLYQTCEVNIVHVSSQEISKKVEASQKVY